jgi:hypothetical protein
MKLIPFDSCRLVAIDWTNPLSTLSWSCSGGKGGHFNSGTWLMMVALLCQIIKYAVSKNENHPQLQGWLISIQELKAQ